MDAERTHCLSDQERCQLILKRASSPEGTPSPGVPHPLPVGGRGTTVRQLCFTTPTCLAEAVRPTLQLHLPCFHCPSAGMPNSIEPACKLYLSNSFQGTWSATGATLLEDRGHSVESAEPPHSSYSQCALVEMKTVTHACNPTENNIF